MILFRAFLFLMAFTLEVRVHAATHATAHGPSPQVDVVQEPKGCLAHEGKCALRASDRPQTLKFGATEIVLDRSTSIVRMATSEILFLSGRAWIKAKGEFTIRTEFGSFQSTGDGDYWITRSAAGRVKISAVTTEVEISPRGSTDRLVVQKGMENWLGQVTDKGFAETGLPVAIDFKAHIERWAHLYRGSKAEFENELAAFHTDWVAAKEEAAMVHRDAYERKVASIDSERERLKKLRQEREAKDRSFRDMFRKKFFDH